MRRRRCMKPGIKHGAIAQFSTKETYGPGDIICIWFQPDAGAKIGVPCALKRLRLALPPWVKEVPYRDHPNSDVAAVVVFETITRAGPIPSNAAMSAPPSTSSPAVSEFREEWTWSKIIRHRELQRERALA